MPDYISPNMTDRRRDFRVKYPSEYRPSLFLMSEEYIVVDLSEHGIKFAYSDIDKLGSKKHLLQDAKAKLLFKDGQQIKFVGDIYRIEKDFAVLFVMKGIPIEKLREENDKIEEQFPINYRTGIFFSLLSSEPSFRTGLSDPDYSPYNFRTRF